MTSKKSLNKIDWIVPVLLVPLLVAIGLWMAQSYSLGIISGISIFLVLTSWLISRFEGQYYLLMILAVFLPFSFEVSVYDNLKINVPSEPLLAIAVFSMGWDILRKPGQLILLFGKETIWALPLLLSFVITSFFSTIVWVSIKFTLVNITYILVFFVWQKHLFQVKPTMFPKALGLFSVALFAVLIYAVVQFQQYGWDPVTIRGIFKPFYKDNTIFGATSALMASYWFVSVLKVKSLTSKILRIFPGFIFLAGVILSTSRAAFLSLIVFGIIWIVLLLRIRLRQIAIGLIPILLILGIFRNSFYQFLLENKHLSHSTQSTYVEQIESSGNISSDISNIERMNRWIAGLRMFAKKPFTGFGPGTYQFAYIPYQKEEFMSRLTVRDPWHIPENSGGTAHSEYLLAISEMGILGLLSLLILFGRWIWIVFERTGMHPRRTNIMVAFAVLSTYLFHAFFNNFLTTDKFAFLFWGIAAWMVSDFESKEYGKPEILQRNRHVL